MNGSVYLAAALALSSIAAQASAHALRDYPESAGTSRATEHPTLSATPLGICAAPCAAHEYEFSELESSDCVAEGYVELRTDGLVVRLADGRAVSVTPTADERFAAGQYVWLLPGGRTTCVI